MYWTVRLASSPEERSTLTSVVPLMPSVTFTLFGPGSTPLVSP